MNISADELRELLAKQLTAGYDIGYRDGVTEGVKIGITQFEDEVTVEDEATPEPAIVKTFSEKVVEAVKEHADEVEVPTEDTAVTRKSNHVFWSIYSEVLLEHLETGTANINLMIQSASAEYGITRASLKAKAYRFDYGIKKGIFYKMTDADRFPEGSPHG